MRLFRRPPSPPPSSGSVADGRDAAEAARHANFEAEAREWARRLIPYINLGLGMIRKGKSGEVRTPGHRSVTYSVGVTSRFVVVNFFGFHGGPSIMAVLRQYYVPLEFTVTGHEPDKGHGYVICIGPPKSQ